MANGGMPIETLRLSAAEKQKLIDYVEHQAKKPIDDDRRALRVNFQGRKVLVKITNKEGQSTVCTVVPRNLSRRGLAFVHGRFVYPDSPCEVTLPMLSGKWTVLRGVARRCRHVNGIVHEVSVVFEETIDLNQFIRLTTEQAERHLAEMTEDGLGDDDLSGNSRGRVLIVDDLAADRRLFSMWMEKMQFTIKEAGDVSNTLQLLNQNSYDLYVIDANLGDEDGIELIQYLRGQGVLSPVIAVSADDTEEYLKRANDAGASAVLTKPLDYETLKTNVLETMSLGGESAEDESPLPSTQDSDPDMAPLIADFVQGLNIYVAKLRNANAEADFDHLQRLCGNLKGAGSSYGFQPLTEVAKLVLEQIEQEEHDVQKIRGGVNDLLTVIRRVQSAYS